MGDTHVTLLKLAKVAMVALWAVTLSGCESLKFWESDEPVAATDKQADPTVDPKAKTTTLSEQELKIARLWARVDEMEEEQFRQKERVRVLEKGLTLGLMPEEMKDTKPVKPAPVKAEPVPTPVEVKEPVAAKPEAPATPGALSPADQEAYKAALASAHAHFGAGRYGRAIVEYSDIGKKFGDQVEGGMHRYWIAKSWMSLKEYSTARGAFGEFLKDFPGSAWAPRAKLDLARVEWKLGLQETALQHFREIIEKHPYEDAAEMAKMELEQLDKTL